MEKEYHKDYYKRNRKELLEKKKEYSQRPNVKKRVKKYQKKYLQIPKIKERYKKYKKEYYKRPEVIEREYKRRHTSKYKKYLKEYCRRPKVRKRKKIYDKEYKKIPEIRERKREIDRKCYKKNREKRLKYKREYFQKIGVKERIQKYRNKKYQNNILFKLNARMSNLVRESLKNNKNGNHWEILVGFTLEDLKKHLESKFKDGMSWDNYGIKGWHIDHIKPVSWFNFKSFEDKEFKECWSLSNLQPLWVSENTSKGNRFIG